MKKQHTLLIATRNEGKIREIKSFLSTLPFQLLTLSDIKKKIPEPEEGGVSLEENAILKATYYGEKTGLLTITEDTGLCIDALDGWPGIFPARIASTDKERRGILLDRMKGVEKERRTATFKTALCLYDPQGKTTHITTGTLEVVIKENEDAVETAINGFGFSTLFIIPEIGKIFEELSVTERNAISHRGKALFHMKYHLQNTYCGKHIIVPCGILIKNGKILMNKRNDPHNPKVHGTWEFPGGAMEMGETFEKNIRREILEETGWKVRVIKKLHHVTIKEYFEQNKLRYQLYLMPFVCKIIGGNGEFHDEEVLEMRWFNLKDVLKQKLMPLNDKMYKAFLPELKDVIRKYNL